MLYLRLCINWIIGIVCAFKLTWSNNFCREASSHITRRSFHQFLNNSTWSYLSVKIIALASVLASFNIVVSSVLKKHLIVEISDLKIWQHCSSNYSIFSSSSWSSGKHSALSKSQWPRFLHGALHYWRAASWICRCHSSWKRNECQSLCHVNYRKEKPFLWYKMIKIEE